MGGKKSSLWQWPLDSPGRIARFQCSCHVALSHLTILPTVLRDADGLAASLEALKLSPQWGGELQGFSGEAKPVLLQVCLVGGERLGWIRQGDGSLALVTDLQLLSRAQIAQELLGLITRRYAAEMALRQVTGLCPGAQVVMAS